MKYRHYSCFDVLGRGGTFDVNFAVFLSFYPHFDGHLDGDLFDAHGESGFGVVSLGFVVGELVYEFSEGVKGGVIIGRNGVGKEVKVGSHKFLFPVFIVQVNLN
jgi:hypothetical protein